MKNLRDLNLKNTYRSFSDNILDEFLLPILDCSNIYYRGAGYFSLSVLSDMLDSILKILKNNGEVFIITSPFLKKEDIDFLDNGNLISNELIERIINQELEIDVHEKNKIEIIAKLIQLEKIKLKIAFLSSGIYHEKIGIVSDGINQIVFIGSLNETNQAYKNNYESIQVLKSWVSKEITDEHIRTFNNIWNGHNEYINVIDFPEASRKKLIDTYKSDLNVDELVSNYKKSKKENTRTLYPFQDTAIREFESNNYKHFFEMATGTGKTFTAINAIKRLDKEKPYVIILVPQVDLQVQWERELKKEGFNNIYLFGGNSIGDWKEELFKSMIENHQNKMVISVIVYDTYFQKVYKEIKTTNVLVVVDEAHNISRNQFKLLSEQFKYRLGLSATPEKHDRKLSKDIVKYFVPDSKTFKFTIEDAINADFLSKYKYYPIFVNLTDKEFEEFSSQNQRLIQLLNSEEIDQDLINKVANNRNNIIKKASAKLKKIEELINNKDEYTFKNTVIYCGRGKYLDTEDKLIDLTTKMLYSANYNVSTYTSNTEDRAKVLELFEKNYYDTLVAIQCFDEGIDVPKLDRIYIMSSDRLLRQTIQRRGRVLRKSKETGKQLAFIYDFIVLPPETEFGDYNSRSLVKIEYERLYEYWRLSENKNDFLHKINNLKEIYNFENERVDNVYDE